MTFRVAVKSENSNGGPQQYQALEISIIIYYLLFLICVRCLVHVTWSQCHIRLTLLVVLVLLVLLLIQVSLPTMSYRN